MILLSAGSVRSNSIDEFGLELFTVHCVHPVVNGAVSQPGEHVRRKFYTLLNPRDDPAKAFEIFCLLASPTTESCEPAVDVDDAVRDVPVTADVAGVVMVARPTGVAPFETVDAELVPTAFTA